MPPICGANKRSDREVTLLTRAGGPSIDLLDLPSLLPADTSTDAGRGKHVAAVHIKRRPEAAADSFHH